MAAVCAENALAWVHLLNFFGRFLGVDHRKLYGVELRYRFWGSSPALIAAVARVSRAPMSSIALAARGLNG